MKDLGIKQDNKIYDHPDSGPKVVYPKIDFPLDFISDKEIKMDDEVIIKVKARVSGFEDNEWRKIVTFEIKEGEIEGKDKTKESKETTLLGGGDLLKSLPPAVVEL